MRLTPQITDSSPNVAMNSLTSCAGPLRTCSEALKSGASNITCAAATPANAPRSCAKRYAGTSRHDSPPSIASASVTAGLKWAPLIGPKVRISATRPAPVAMVLASKASAMLPAASRSAMIPEPTTVASKSAVPTASATTRRASGDFIAREPRPRRQRGRWTHSAAD